MTIQEIRKCLGMSQAKFAKYFNIPFRTVQNWEYGVSECPEYLKELILYKLKKENVLIEK